jgi:hypothetical protein
VKKSEETYGVTLVTSLSFYLNAGNGVFWVSAGHRFYSEKSITGFAWYFAVLIFSPGSAARVGGEGVDSALPDGSMAQVSARGLWWGW